MNIMIISWSSSSRSKCGEADIYSWISPAAFQMEILIKRSWWWCWTWWTVWNNCKILKMVFESPSFAKPDIFFALFSNFPVNEAEFPFHNISTIYGSNTFCRPGRSLNYCLANVTFLPLSAKVLIHHHLRPFSKVEPSNIPKYLSIKVLIHHRLLSKIEPSNITSYYCHLTSNPLWCPLQLS